MAKIRVELAIQMTPPTGNLLDLSIIVRSWFPQSLVAISHRVIENESLMGQKTPFSAFLDRKCDGVGPSCLIGMLTLPLEHVFPMNTYPPATPNQILDLPHHIPVIMRWCNFWKWPVFHRQNGSPRQFWGGPISLGYGWLALGLYF